MCVFVCLHLHMRVCVCVSVFFYAFVCVLACVQGPAPPWPLSLERLRGSLAFRFKLNPEDESSLSLSLFPTPSSTPPPLSACFFFIHEGKQERKIGGGKLGWVGGRKQMRAPFFPHAARDVTHGDLCSLFSHSAYLKGPASPHTQAFTAATTFYVTRTHTYTDRYPHRH